MNKNYNISNNKYPVVMTLKEDLIKNNDLDNKNNIDFLCVIDFKLDSKRCEQAKEIIYAINNNLIKNDKITFVNFIFDNYNERQNLKNFLGDRIQNNIKLGVKLSFSLWDKKEKKLIDTTEYKNIQNQISEYTTRECKKNEGNQNSNIIKTIFYFTEDHNKNYMELLNDINKCYNDLEDFSLYLISGDPTYPKSFSIFSDSRNISYIPFHNESHPNEEDKKIYGEFINKTIDDIRKIKYKDNQISITSKYNISIFYGKHYLNITPTIENGNYIYSFQQYQFISEKEYTYAFEVDLDENIKYGDRILNVKFIYKYLNGSMAEPSFSSLKFYNAINYFNAKKDEFCRILLIQTIELYLINKDTYLYDELKNEIGKVNNFCKKDFTENITNEIFNDKRIALVQLTKILRNLF